jgi:hypothetical protein
MTDLSARVRAKYDQACQGDAPAEESERDSICSSCRYDNSGQCPSECFETGWRASSERS